VGRAHALGILAIAVWLAVAVGAQQAPAPAPGGRAGGPPPGRIGGAGIGAYPQREVSDAAAVERGRGVYGTYCAFCHGQDTRGGDGGPSLLRSQLVLDDQNGELIGPVVLTGRPEKGMPKFALTPAQVTDVAAFMHSFRVNGYDTARNRPTTIVVGNAAAGEAYFTQRCASCHAGARDLRGIATRIDNPRTLQQVWLMPDSGAGRGMPPPPNSAPPRAIVTTGSGEQIEGDIERLDDFSVAIRRADGSRRSWRIANGSPRVEVIDPLRGHRELLSTYSDSDIHNVTAYLVTLK
jgi:cytochrome c oxidase cbb3-type subunit III